MMMMMMILFGALLNRKDDVFFCSFEVIEPILGYFFFKFVWSYEAKTSQADPENMNTPSYEFIALNGHSLLTTSKLALKVPSKICSRQQSDSFFIFHRK